MTWNADKTAIVYFDFTEHEWLSNFWLSPIMWTTPRGGRIMVDTVEHAYQAEKTSDPRRFISIASAKTPGKAKSMGNNRRKTLMTADWDERKFTVMLDLLRLKFVPGSALARRLLETNDVFLLEGNHWHDNIWGDCVCEDCVDIVGQNNLGRQLMRVRDELRS